MRLLNASSEPEKFPKGYVAALHDMVTAYHDKLAEVLSPADLEQIQATVADRIMKNLVSRDDEKWAEKVGELLEEWGLKLRTENHLQGQLKCRIECPFAHIVHPLYANPTFCPLSTLVLGAARSAHPKAKLSSIQLTEEGTEFMIES